MKKFNLNIQDFILITISLSIIFISKLVYHFKIEYVYLILILPSLIIINTILKSYNKYIAILIIFIIIETLISKKIISKYNIFLSLGMFYIGINSNYKMNIIPPITIKSLVSILISLLLFFFTKDIKLAVFFFSITNLLTGEGISLISLFPLITIYFLFSSIKNFIGSIIAIFTIFIIIQVYTSFLKKNIEIELLTFITGSLFAIFDSNLMNIPIYFLGIFWNHLLNFNSIENKKYDVSIYSLLLLSLITALSVDKITLNPILLFLALAIVILDIIQKSIEVESMLICLSLVNNNKISSLILFTVILLMVKDILYIQKRKTKIVKHKV